LIYFATATPSDLAEVLNLLEHNHLPKAGVDQTIQNFMVALEDDKIIGCAGLEMYGRVGLLRSVAVHETYRSQGLGTQLVEGILNLAEHQELSSVSLLTETAQDYFPRFGFSIVPRTELPYALQASQEFKGACPDSAIAMMLEL
jgi:amino-acid N-acetyltransferase